MNDVQNIVTADRLFPNLIKRFARHWLYLYLSARSTDSIPVASRCFISYFISIRETFTPSTIYGYIYKINSIIKSSAIFSTHIDVYGEMRLIYPWNIFLIRKKERQ